MSSVADEGIRHELPVRVQVAPLPPQQVFTAWDLSTDPALCVSPGVTSMRGTASARGGQQADVLEKTTHDGTQRPTWLSDCLGGVAGVAVATPSTAPRLKLKEKKA